jgi:single stranded DNA-binding protein (ssb)
MNDAKFIGNLTRDPDVKVMTNGKPRAMFTVAVQRRYTNQQTGKREADFISFIAYDKNAELAEKYMTKGRKVAIESHVRTGSYERDGRTIYTTEFIVDHIEFLTSAQSQGQQEQEQTPPSEEAPPEAMGGFTEVDDEELPF